LRFMSVVAPLSSCAPSVPCTSVSVGRPTEPRPVLRAQGFDATMLAELVNAV
jgi:hypothetical protein